MCYAQDKDGIRILHNIETPMLLALIEKGTKMVKDGERECTWAYKSVGQESQGTKEQTRAARKQWGITSSNERPVSARTRCAIMQHA